MTDLLERIGDQNILIMSGLLIGLLFGALAQQSRFCLRAATVEFWRGNLGERLAVWLLVFSPAFVATQFLIANESLDPSSIRQLTGTGSLSGAIIGGALFGVGMVLARGCASRLLVLSATGNLRALMTGLLLTIVAQAALTGVFSPVRTYLSGLWLVSGSQRDVASLLPSNGVPVLAALLLIAAALQYRRSGLAAYPAIAAVGTGLCVAAGWWVTNWQSGWSFEPTSVQSITFTGPSADTLMALIYEPAPAKSFGTGLVPGVFAGSFLTSTLTREFKVQSFDTESGMLRYLVGAALMGFGGMLAGGCAVGAGITGGSVLALTAWVALTFMWVFAGLTDLLIDRRAHISNAGGVLSASR